MIQKDLKQLQEEGYVILRNKVSSDWLYKLSTAIDNSFIEHRKIQIKNNNDIQTDGVALHVILNDSIFLEFLKYLQDTGFIK